MKKLIQLIAIWATTQTNVAFTQQEKPTNIYVSNLEENMYFEGYDAKTSTIKGLKFMLLTDGDNSLDKTPAFTVKLYLYQQGLDPIFIKTYELERGMKHLSSKDFSGDVSLAGQGIPEGEYRLGVYVNADNSFEEDQNDNAMLFRDPINVKKSSQNEAGGIYNINKKKKDDDWKEEDTEDEDEDEDNDDETDDDDW